MIDFFFFMKTLFLTLIVVLCLQIDVGGQTAEKQIHAWMQNALVTGFLSHAAHGGAHMIKDATHKLTEKMQENIGIKHGSESSETKASRFHWGWDSSKKKPAPASHDEAD